MSKEWKEVVRDLKKKKNVSYVIQEPGRVSEIGKSTYNNNVRPTGTVAHFSPVILSCMGPDSLLVKSIAFVR